MNAMYDDPAHIAQRTYMKNYRAKDPEKTKKKVSEYWTRKAEKMGIQRTKADISGHEGSGEHTE